MKSKNKITGMNEYDMTDTEFWTNFTEYSTDNLQQSISDKTNLEDIIKALKIFFFSLPLFILYFYDSFINALYTEPTIMFAMGLVIVSVAVSTFFAWESTSDESWDDISIHSLILEKIVINTHEDPINSKKTNSQKLLNVLGKVWSKEYVKDFKLIKSKKIKSYEVDIYEANSYGTYSIKGMLGTKDAFIVKSFNQSKPVSKKELSELSDQITNYTKITDIRRRFFGFINANWTSLSMKYNNFSVYAISSNGFTDDAINYVNNPKNSIFLFGFDDENKKDIYYEYSSSICLIEEQQTNNTTQLNPFKLITNPELSELEKNIT